MQTDDARLDELDLDLEDFSFDFENIAIPHGNFTDEELKARADLFVSAILD